MPNMEKIHQFLTAYDMIQLESFADSQFEALKLTKEQIHWLESCDSTNAFIKTQLAEADTLEQPIVCISDVQTAGKGQREKTWQSPLGNMHFSMYLPISQHLSHSKDMTHIDGRLALETAISLVSMPLLLPAKLNAGFKMGIKWPNDLCTFVRGAENPQAALSKFAGILIEPVSIKPRRKDDTREITLAELPRVKGVIIGIGMNANHTETTQIDGRPINNLQTMLNHTVSIPDLAAQTCQACQKAVETFMTHSSSLPVRFFSHDLLYDKAIAVKQIAGDVAGIATGIQADGALTLMKSLDNSIAIYDGEVSLTK